MGRAFLIYLSTFPNKMKEPLASERKSHYFNIIQIIVIPFLV